MSDPLGPTAPPAPATSPGPTLPLDDVGALMAALRERPPPGEDPPGPLPPPSEGRVLRVQLGYNPNSSSLGTSVVMLLWGMGTAVILLQAVAVALLRGASAGADPSPGALPDPREGVHPPTHPPREAP